MSPEPAADSSVQKRVRTCMSIPGLHEVPPEALTVVPRGASEPFAACLKDLDRTRLLGQLCAALKTIDERDRRDAIRLIGYLARELLDGSAELGERQRLLFLVSNAYRGLQDETLYVIMSELARGAYPVSSADAQLPKSLAEALNRECANGTDAHLLGPLLQIAGLVARMGSAAPDVELEEASRQGALLGFETSLRNLHSERRDSLADGLSLLSDAIFAGALDSPQALDDSVRALQALQDVDYGSGIESSAMMGALVNQIAQATAESGPQGRVLDPEVAFLVREVRRKFALNPSSLRVITAVETFILTEVPATP